MSYTTRTKVKHESLAVTGKSNSELRLFNELQVSALGMNLAVLNGEGLKSQFPEFPAKVARDMNSVANTD